MLCSLQRDDVGIYNLQLCREEAMNALSTDMLSEMSACLTNVATDDMARCLVITGGDRAFCAGADLKERRQMSEAQARQAVAAIRGVVQQVADVPVPVIAAIKGVALGGGLELALACDLRVAAHDAVCGLPETRLAIIPGAGGTQRLTRHIGMAAAKVLIYTGRRITGDEAHAISLVEFVEDSASVLDRAMAIAREIASAGPLAIRQAKWAIMQGAERSLAEGQSIEQQAYERVLASEDRREGLQAFAEKRPPVYRGR